MAKRAPLDQFDLEAEREAAAIRKAAQSGQLQKIAGMKGKRHGQVSREIRHGTYHHTNIVVRRCEKGQ